MHFPSFFRFEDIFIVPVSLMIIYAIAYSIRRKYNKTVLKQYFFPGLFIRLAIVILYAALIQFYYSGQGDTSIYYQAVLDMHKAIDEDLSMLKDIYLHLTIDPGGRLFPYFVYDEVGGYTQYVIADSRNFIVPRFGFVFSMLFFKSYLCLSFFMSFFAFAGCWRMFKVFYGLYPHLHKKAAIACLYLPSVIFWGVGLVKDSICIGALGFMFYALYSIFFRRKKIPISIVIAILSGLLLFNVKPYIFLCFISAFVLWLFLHFSKLIKDRTLRSVATFMFAIVGSVATYFLIQYFTETELTAHLGAENLLDAVAQQQRVFEQNTTTGGTFQISHFDNTLTGFLLLFPEGVGTTLFRPFLWEIKNPLMLLSALEAAGFLVLTIMCFRTLGFFKTFGMIFSDRTTLMFFVYSILFAGLIGITTPNFGSLVRYKIPCLPFYIMMIFIVMDRSGKFSPNYIFSKKYF
jgi:hypothetical protein